ncbi:thioredoxin domain-containing protein [Aeromonas hydrophila]|uniref:hypothetical protein n=1 Tax=Aeromonas hydrophila TaxID=644 RepID=UPI002B459F96|nr:hypothetical protein [Aeromonas hydrophila]
MSVGIKGVVTGVLLLLAGAGGLWFTLGGSGSEEDNPWLRGAEGYAQAQQLALHKGYPLLYVIERAKCRRCKLLETTLWQSEEMAPVLARLVKVRLNPDAGDGSEHILRRFPQVATPPGIYVQQPGEPLKPIKIVVDIQQIWMPGVTWQRGFFMPLSAAGFEAVLHTTQSLQDPALDNAPLL